MKLPAIIFAPTRNNGKGQWRLDIPASFARDGKRKQIHYPPTLEGKQAAQEERQTLIDAFRQFGKSGPSLTHAELWDAKGALDILEPLGATLTQAAQHYAKRFATRETWAAFVETYLLLKLANRTSRYRANVAALLARLTAAFGEGRCLSDIDRPQAIKAVESAARTNSVYNRIVTVARPVFDLAIERGLIEVNPLSNVSKRDESGQAIAILPVADAARLLNAANGWLRDYVALLLFSGIRPEEAQRLQWSDVHFDKAAIDVRKAGWKRGSKNVISLLQTLAAWLTEGKTGLIVPVSEQLFKDAWRELRKSAGLTDWQRDTCRHSFISYHFAMWEDAAKTQKEARHKDAAMMTRHYLYGVTKSDAEAYWALRPAADQS